MTNSRPTKQCAGASFSSLVLAVIALHLEAAGALAAPRLANFSFGPGPTHTADFFDSLFESHFGRSLFVLGSFGGLIRFGTIANAGATVTGPQTLNADINGDVILAFDVLDADAPYAIAVDVRVAGKFTTFDDGLLSGENGQAFASISDIIGPGFVVAAAKSRGPTSVDGSTLVEATGSGLITAAPPTTHHELRFRWSTRCSSIIDGLLGNGHGCNANFGALNSDFQENYGLFITAHLIAGTPTPTSTATPIDTDTATSTATPINTKTPTPTATPGGQAQLVIHDASLTEGNARTRAMLFNVSVTGPRQGTISVSFATANLTALAGQDYNATAGTLTIQPHENAKTISVPVIGDLLPESSETFTVNLSGPVNAQLADGSGRGLIVDDDLVGAPDLLASSTLVLANEIATLTLRWTHPDRWRDLDTVDLRLRDESGAVFWSRFREGDDAFSLCDDGQCGANVAADGPPVAAGAATFYPASSRVQGSGLTGPSVDLTFALSLDESAAGRTFDVEVAATDDEGEEQPFATVGSLTVGEASGGGDGCAMRRDDHRGWPWLVGLVAALAMARLGSIERKRRRGTTGHLNPKAGEHGLRGGDPRGGERRTGGD